MSNINITHEDFMVRLTINGKLTEFKHYCKFSVKHFTEFYAQVSLARRHRGEDIKKAYTDAGNFLGCSVQMAVKMFNGAMNEAFLNINYKYTKRFCYYRGYLSNERVNGYSKRYKYIRVFEADATDNVIGYGLLFDSPQKAKKILGKGLWKKICATSRSRNDMITVGIANRMYKVESITKIIRTAHGIPSTLLKKVDWLMAVCYLPEHVISDIITACDKPLYKISLPEFAKSVSVWYDCKRFLQDDFNASWSFKRVIKEHDIERKRQHRLRYSTATFDYVKHIPSVIETDKYRAELIKNAVALADLGADQHHCVAGYHSSCTSNKYIVYKITTIRTSKISTLGFHSIKEIVGVTQHYYTCNGIIDDDNLVDFGESVKNKVQAAFPKDLLTTVETRDQVLIEIDQDNQAIPYTGNDPFEECNDNEPPF